MLLRSKARNNNVLAILSDHEEDSGSENTNNNIDVNQLVAQADAVNKVVKIKLPKVVQSWENNKEACIFPGTKGTAAALKLYHVPTIIFHEILVEALSIRKFIGSPLCNELRAKYIMKKLYKIFGKRLKFYRGLSKHKDADCVVMKEKEVEELAEDGPLINYIERHATKRKEKGVTAIFKTEKFLNKVLPTKNPEVHQEVMDILEHGVDEHALPPNPPAGNSEGGDVFNPESPGNSEDGGDSEGETDPLLPDLFRNNGGGGAEEEEDGQEEEEDYDGEEEAPPSPQGNGGFDHAFDSDEEVEEPPNDGGGDDEFHDALDTLSGGEEDNDVFYEVNNNNPPHHQLENNGHNNNINMSANNVGNINNKRKGSGRKLLSVARIIGIIITSSLYFFVGCRQSLSATSSAKDSKDASVVVSDDANKDNNFTNRTLIHLEDETAINVINNFSHMGDSSSILNSSFTSGVGNGSSPPSNGCSSYVNSPFVYTGNNLKNEAPRMKAKENAKLARGSLPIQGSLFITDYCIPDISLEFTEAVSSICISADNEDLIQNSTVEVVMSISDDTRDNVVGTNEHPVWVWYIKALAILLVSGISVWVCFLYVDISSTTNVTRGLAGEDISGSDRRSSDVEMTEGSSPSRDGSGLERRVMSSVDVPVLNVGTSNRISTKTITGDTSPRDLDRNEPRYLERVLRLGHPEVEIMQFE